jgi:hypothetical protein
MRAVVVHVLRPSYFNYCNIETNTMQCPESTSLDIYARQKTLDLFDTPRHDTT